MSENIMDVVCSKFVIQNPQGCPEKKKAEQGSKAMEDFFRHCRTVSGFKAWLIEDPCSKLQEIFDRKKVCHFQIRSVTLQHAAGLALTFAVQNLTRLKKLLFTASAARMYKARMSPIAKMKKIGIGVNPNSVPKRV